MTLVSQMTEKMWPFLLIGAITVSSNGIVTCSSTKGLRLKQIVTFDKAGVGPKDFEIKRVLSNTDFLVGDPSKNIGTISKPVEYSGGLAAINEQQRNTIGDGYVLRNVYENDPVMALRTILVDEFGNYYNQDNPLAVDVEVTIGTVDVAMDAFTKVPADNVLIVGSEDGTQTGVKHAAKIDSDGNLNVMNMGQLVPKVFDTIVAAYPSVTTETYTYKTGGIGGTTIAVITVIYTDSSKNILTSVSRS